MTILEKILATKRQEIDELCAEEPLPALIERARGVRAALGFCRALRRCRPAVIAEIKRASPSRGAIRADLDPVQAAAAFSNNGAACLSILTDRTYFSGSLDFLSAVRQAAPDTPLLRKDFVIDPYQVWEAKAAGADAVLLIVAAHDPQTLLALREVARDAALDVLIEIHDERELESVLPLLRTGGATKSELLLGINNRNLRTFEVDLNTTLRLMAVIQKELGEALAKKAEPLVVVAESGIRNAEDVATFFNEGVRAFLVGEALVAAGDPGENLRTLIQTSQRLLEQRE